MAFAWVNSLEEVSTAEVTLKFEPDHFAERLRVRKGDTVRWTLDGKVIDYRVAKVSMPDEYGNVKVDVTAAESPHPVVRRPQSAIPSQR